MPIIILPIITREPYFISPLYVNNLQSPFVFTNLLAPAPIGFVHTLEPSTNNLDPRPYHLLQIGPDLDVHTQTRPALYVEKWE